MGAGVAMRVLIGGATGLIGSALKEALLARGDKVAALVRRPAASAHEISWNPQSGELSPQSLEGFDAIVLLNGASVGRLPWTSKYRGELVASRLESTRTIVRALQRMTGARPALLSGSAVGFYGSAPGVILDEASPAGGTFLAKLCVEWEAAAREAEAVTSVALLRTAPVIHRRGVLRPMVTLTNLGLGGPLGSGKQIWPWISLADEVRAILHVLDERLSGPVNLCGPTPATANQTGRALARNLRRPFLLPAPEWALRLGLGKAATESLLTSDADVRPHVLLESGFAFTHETVEAAVASAIREK